MNQVKYNDCRNQSTRSLPLKCTVRFLPVEEVVSNVMGLRIQVSDKLIENCLEVRIGLITM